MQECVKVFCPLRNVEEYVFFNVILHEGMKKTHPNMFNGCDHEWHKCEECEECKELAYRKLMNR